MRDVEEFLGLRKCNYSGLDKKIHEGKSASIPSWVEEVLMERLKDQQDFLISEFGMEFYRSC